MTWLLKFPSFTTTELREGADEDKTITLKSCHRGFKIGFYKLEMCYVRTLQFYVQTVNTGNKVLLQCLQHMYVTLSCKDVQVWDTVHFPAVRKWLHCCYNGILT